MITIRLYRSAAALAAAGLFLAGCAPMATQPPTPRPAPEPAPEPEVRATPLERPDVEIRELPESRPSEPPRQTSPAVLALVRQADQRRSRGDLAGAQSTLERAVKIEPGNARLWLDLAQLRLAQGEPAQAEQLALRAVEHARDSEILSAAWRVVARARRARGDEAGAREAEKRAGQEPSAGYGGIRQPA